MKVKPTVNAQPRSEESINSIAVKEDRHRNINTPALKQDCEEPWTVDRVVGFIILGYRGIMLKSDKEPVTIAFRTRVAEMCKAEVATEDAVEGGKQSNGLIEYTVMLIRGILRTIICHIESRTQGSFRDDSPILPWLVEQAGCILSRCQKGRDGKTPCERAAWQEPSR